MRCIFKIKRFHTFIIIIYKIQCCIRNKKNTMKTLKTKHTHGSHYNKIERGRYGEPCLHMEKTIVSQRLPLTRVKEKYNENFENYIVFFSSNRYSPL